MKFGGIPVGEAAGAILVHGARYGGETLKKGLRLDAAHVEGLQRAGVESVTVARLEEGDIHEDEAARMLADALAGPSIRVQRPFTGRANLLATESGIAAIDAAAIDAVNGTDEAVTVATLPPFEAVSAGRMVATVKIIPFAVQGDVLDRCLAAARVSGRAIGVAPFKLRRAALIMTRTAAVKDRVLDKTAGVVADRLAALGLALDGQVRIDHRTDILADRIAEETARHDLVLICGASAIADRRDVIPAAIERAGGSVDRLGMPVDPGNLLLLGHLGTTAIVGLPGCARSPKLNGFDWILRRIAAGLRVTGRDIAAMGVGGLLKEIPLRPRPRAAPEDAGDRARRPPRIAAIVLAAGQSRRMGSRNKLLVEIGDRPMVRHTVDALIEAGIATVTAVTGHEAEAVEAALEGRDLTVVRNEDFAAGLSTSLRTGLAALPADIDAVIVALGDMPGVAADAIARLVAAYDPVEGRAIVVPTHDGKRGNPVLWDRRFFEAMAAVTGDTGARHLIGENEDLVAEVEMADDSVLVDIDTPEALAGARS